MAEKEYYEREAVLSKFLECGIGWGAAKVKGVINSIPAADVREVVLCRDCVYLSHDKYGAWCINNYEANLKDDDFCSHGKRKEKQT